MERFDPHGLRRDLDLALAILTGPTRGLPKLEPTGGLIGGGRESVGFESPGISPRVGVALYR